MSSVLKAPSVTVPPPSRVFASDKCRVTGGVHRMLCSPHSGFMFYLLAFTKGQKKKGV